LFLIRLFLFCTGCFVSRETTTNCAFALRDSSIDYRESNIEYRTSKQDSSLARKILTALQGKLV
jgi:hypothetical protein